MAGKKVYLWDPLRTKEIIRQTESFLINRAEKEELK